MCALVSVLRKYVKVCISYSCHAISPNQTLLINFLHHRDRHEIHHIVNTVFIMIK